MSMTQTHEHQPTIEEQERERALMERTHLNRGAVGSLMRHQQAWAQRIYAQARGEASCESLPTEGFLELIQVALDAISGTQYSPQLKHRVKDTITQALRLYRIDQEALSKQNTIRLLNPAGCSWTTFVHVDDEEDEAFPF